MTTEELLGKVLTKALGNVGEILNNAFLKDYGEGNWDWTDDITKEQYNALNEVSSFFLILENWHLYSKDNEEKLKKDFPKLFEDVNNI